MLVGLTLLAHLLAFFATDRMARYPGREAWGLAAFNLLLFTLLLLAVLALGRLYYSRAFLLLATSLAFPSSSSTSTTCPRPPRPPSRGARGPTQGHRQRGEAHRGPGGGRGSGGGPSPSGPEGPSPPRRGLPEGLPILHAALVYEGYTGRVPLEGSYGEGLLVLSEGNRGLYPYFKRPFEVGLVLLFAPLILLLGLLVALLVYLDLGRPVLFAQERMGLGGGPSRPTSFAPCGEPPGRGSTRGRKQTASPPWGSSCESSA